MEVKILKVTLKDSRIKTIQNIKKNFSHLSSSESKDFMDKMLLGTLEETLEDHHLYDLKEIFADVEYEKLPDEEELYYIQYYTERDKELKEARAWYDTLSEKEQNHIDNLMKYNLPTC